MEAAPSRTTALSFGDLHVVATAIDRAIHDLTTAGGLIVADGAKPEETFTLDFSETVVELQTVSKALRDLSIPVTKSPRRRISPRRMPKLSQGVLTQIAGDLGITRQAIYQRYQAGDAAILARAIDIERKLEEQRQSLIQELREIVED